MSDRSLRRLNERTLFSRKWLWSFIGAVVIFAVISLASGNSWVTLGVSSAFASFLVLVGIGQMLVITTGPGNIDLSIPYTVAISGLAAMKVMNGIDAGIPLGILAGLATGTAIGLFNYGLILFGRIPPMIATLGSGFVIQSVAIAYFRGLQIKPPRGFDVFVSIRFGQLPVLFVFVLAVSVVVHMVLTYSKYGRFIHAIGQNMKAAILSGIRVHSMKAISYVLCGQLAALTGILLSGFSGGASLDMGTEYMLNSIAVVVLGGSSIAGGNSNMPGIIGASLFLCLMTNLLNILNLGAGLRYILTGLIIVAVIFASGEKARSA
jgi:ribose transport system permease protein